MTRLDDVMAEWTDLHWQAEEADAQLRWCPNHYHWRQRSKELHARIAELKTEREVLLEEQRVDEQMEQEELFGWGDPLDGIEDELDAYEADMADRENDCRKAEGR